MSKEFKGTKGQWELIGNEIHCNNLLVGYATNSFSFFKNSTNNTEAKANALLMSKAPEMLEALQFFVNNNMLSVIGEEVAERLINEILE